MKTVKDAMTPSVISIPPHALIDAAIEKMLNDNVSGLPVVDGDGRLVGVITEYDVLRLYGCSREEYLPYEPCERFMTKDVKAIQEAASLEVAAKIFQGASLRRLFVLAGDRLVGVLSRRDILRCIRADRLAFEQAESK